MKVINKIALALVIIGALVWGMVGLFNFNLVGWLFSGNLAFIARIIYTLVGISGIWCISLLFYSLDETEERHSDKYESFHTGTI